MDKLVIKLSFFSFSFFNLLSKHKTKVFPLITGGEKKKKTKKQKTRKCGIKIDIHRAYTSYYHDSWNVLENVLTHLTQIRLPSHWTLVKQMNNQCGLKAACVVLVNGTWTKMSYFASSLYLLIYLFYNVLPCIMSKSEAMGKHKGIKTARNTLAISYIIKVDHNFHRSQVRITLGTEKHTTIIYMELFQGM